VRQAGVLPEEAAEGEVPQEKGAEEVRHRTCAAERMQRAVENQERKRQEKAARKAAKQAAKQAAQQG
jgi:hypothetical protein